MIDLKSPESVIPVELSWNGRLADGDTIASAQWSVSPDETGGIAIDDTIISTEYHLATAVISGGKRGRLYTLSCRIITALGFADARSMAIRVAATSAEAAA